jgi:hypothetical protein
MQSPESEAHRDSCAFRRYRAHALHESVNPDKTQLDEGAFRKVVLVLLLVSGAMLAASAWR